MELYQQNYSNNIQYLKEVRKDDSNTLLINEDTLLFEGTHIRLAISSQAKTKSSIFSNPKETPISQLNESNDEEKNNIENYKRNIITIENILTKKQLTSTSTNEILFETDLDKYQAGVSVHFATRWCQITRSKFMYFDNKWSANCRRLSPIYSVNLKTIEKAKKVISTDNCLKGIKNKERIHLFEIEFKETIQEKSNMISLNNLKKADPLVIDKVSNKYKESTQLSSLNNLQFNMENSQPNIVITDTNMNLHKGCREIISMENGLKAGMFEHSKSNPNSRRNSKVSMEKRKYNYRCNKLS